MTEWANVARVFLSFFLSFTYDPPPATPNKHDTPQQNKTESMILGDTNLERDSLGFFCHHTVSSVFLEADCLGDSPEVDCPCCVSCYNNETQDYVVNLPKVCQLETHLFLDDNDDNHNNGGNNYGSNGDMTSNDRNVTCACHHDDVRGYTMSCSEDCTSCTKDGSYCVRNVDYGYTYDEFGVFNSSRSTFRSIRGRNETVLFETGFAQDDDDNNGGSDGEGDGNENDNHQMVCSVSIDGRKCRDCGKFFCPSGFSGFHARCDNVEGFGNIDLCDDHYDDGVLSVFTMQDPMQNSGSCHPIFVPVY